MAKSWKNLPHWHDWRPREGQYYYFIDKDKKVKKEMWMGIDNNSNNEEHYKSGNIYQSEDQAKKTILSR